MRCGLRGRSSMCKGSGGGVSICVWMNSVCTNSGGTATGVGRPGVGMNLISSLPCTTVGAGPAISGGDVRVVGNGDILGDVGGQVPSLLMDGDPNVSLWANVWDGPASSCVMEPTS